MSTALVQAIAVRSAAPSLADNTADLDRLKKALRPKLAGSPLNVPFARLALVASRFRQAGFAGKAVVNRLPAGWELVDFVPEHTASRLSAMALDLGTTHLAAELIDLEVGKVLATAGRANSQIEYGDDILSRIHYAARDGGLATLAAAIRRDISWLAAELADKAGIRPQEIRALSVSGNTTMVQLFLELDPYQLCREPYIPVANNIDILHAADLGLEMEPWAPVLVLPNVGSYFGGDLISGIVASGMAADERVSMLIDVGTNAEVVVGNRDWLIACAGAAGPALEGGIARMGMRAQPGAIERVNIDPKTGKLSYRTLGDAAPKGICGSGMIDLVASLYLARIIDIRGKFRPDSHPRLRISGENASFILVEEKESATDEDVALDQVDLDAMMRSKAAMYAILKTLVNQVGMSFEDLNRIFVAGAFGQHIDPRSAIVLGMLPDLPMDRFQAIGNSSLAGARRVLLEEQARQESRRVTGMITYVELNVNHEFMNRFSGARFIPHTDHTLFPSVPYFGDSV
jgi:uncharacterized 2Fe-2S/4Fe-4S cluster protein (DUF4445 family)